MLGIGGQALQAVRNELPQGTDVLMFRGQHAHFGGLGHKISFHSVPDSRLRKRAGAVELGKKVPLGVQRHMDAGHDRFLVKICIGNSRKQIQRDKMIDLRGNRLSRGAQRGGNGREAAGHVDQQILHSRYIRFLAAHAGLRASGTARSLLTLIAEHFVFHLISSLHLNQKTDRSNRFFLPRLRPVARALTFWAYYNIVSATSMLF